MASRYLLLAVVLLAWALQLLHSRVQEQAGVGVSLRCWVAERAVFLFEHYVMGDAPAPLRRLAYLDGLASKRCLRDPRAAGEQLALHVPENASRFQFRVWDQYHPLKVTLHGLLTATPAVAAARERLWLSPDFIGEPSPWTRYSGRSLGISDPKQHPWWWVPGLRALRHWPAEDFPWVRDLEAKFGEIWAEFKALNEAEGLSGYRVPRGKMSLINDWKTFHLTGQTGMIYQDHVAKVPRTWAALQAISRLEPHNMLMFSTAMPGFSEGEHTGWSNLFLRCHLTLANREPDKAWISVGGQRLSWQEGRVLIFDDSYWHSFANHGAKPRVVLFFDIWHPDIPEEALPELKRVYGEWRQADSARVFQDKLREIEDVSPKQVLTWD